MRTLKFSTGVKDCTPSQVVVEDVALWARKPASS
jgi:hypothetical protein